MARNRMQNDLRGKAQSYNTRQRRFLKPLALEAGALPPSSEVTTSKRPLTQGEACKFSGWPG